MVIKLVPGDFLRRGKGGREKTLAAADHVIFKHPEKLGVINNGNWTEWRAIWSEIICVISKSNERAARVRFDITTTITAD